VNIDVDANASSKNVPIAAFLTEGEQRLANFFKNNLPYTWKMYVKPNINGITPDFVLLNPEVGLMIYEVIENDQDFTSKYSNHRLIPSKNRTDYINHYKDKIIQLIPDIGESINYNRDIYGIFSRGIYFHNLDGKEARKKFGHRHIKIIGFDDLESSKICQIVPGTEYKFSYMDKTWSEELLFWLEPSIHHRKSRNFKLNDSQLKHAEPAAGFYRLRGPAGSGKTLVIAHRAAKLASMGYKVLIITYNRSLWPYIRKIIAKTHFEFDWSLITFNYFHGFCKDIMANLNIYQPSDFNKENLAYIVSKINTAIKKSNPNVIEKLKFDAILIDEGQDYDSDSFNLLCNFLNDRKELLLVWDENQNIFGNDINWTSKFFRGDWRRLYTCYRFPREIGDLINKFSSEFDLEELVNIESVIQKKLIDQNSYVRWDNIRGEEYVLYVMEAYNIIKTNSYSFSIDDSDITILLPTKKMGKALLRFLRNNQVSVDHVFETSDKPNNKKLFDLVTARLTLSTIHQYKGQEASYIIILIPDKWVNDDNLDEVIYTGITRARKGLIVLNCNDKYWEFGEKISYKKIELSKEDSIQTISKNLMKNLPQPFSSVLENNKTNYDAIDTFLEFFERFSEFIDALLLSYTFHYFPRIKNQYQNFLFNPDKLEWINESSFEAWNSFGRDLIIRILIEAHKTGESPNLKNIISLKLNDIFQEVASLKINWKGLGSPESDREYYKRYKTLLKNLSHLNEQISDVFENIILIVAYEESENDGNYHYKIKRFYGDIPSSTENILRINEKINLNDIYILDKSQNKLFKLFPLLLERKNNCYFYDGKLEYDEEKFSNHDKAVYTTFNDDLQDEILMFSEIDNLWLFENE
jgi:hypothetical protein